MVGRKLKELMDARGLKAWELRDLTAASGPRKITDTSIYAILAGNNPRILTLYRLALALEVSVHEMIDEDELEAELEECAGCPAAVNDV